MTDGRVEFKADVGECSVGGGERKATTFFGETTARVRSTTTCTICYRISRRPTARRSVTTLLLLVDRWYIIIFYASETPSDVPTRIRCCFYFFGRQRLSIFVRNPNAFLAAWEQNSFCQIE